MYSPEIMNAFREFKTIWDPDWKMNPGKVVNPYRVDENLREGAGYRLPKVKTHFHFPDDHHSFASASDRCVGAGVCRRHDSADGTMCPSYMVTLEEKHSTRGRARLLNEMIRAEVLTTVGETNPCVKHWIFVSPARDANMIARFRWTWRPIKPNSCLTTIGWLRPRYAYTSGLIYWWSRAAARMPRVCNFFTQTPGLSNLVKFAGGYSQQRHIPPFAPETFKQWFVRREPRNAGAPDVFLWVDTFNNHFTPSVARQPSRSSSMRGIACESLRKAFAAGDLCMITGCWIPLRRCFEIL